MLLTALAVFGLDRLLKGWVLAHLAWEGSIDLFPGVFRLVCVQNTGAAFGLFARMPWVGYVMAPAVLIIAWLALRSYRLGLWPRLCAGAILGGALGNYLDRLLYGYVIDMVDLTFMNFAVFNLADAAICLGGILMAVSLLFRTNDWRPRHGGRD